MPSYYTETKYGGMQIKGELGPHCADVGAFLCDYPIGDGLTCDRSLREEHGHTVGGDAHYCYTHFQAWRTHNPNEPEEYELIRYRLRKLPGMAHVALTFLKQAFDARDTGHRDHHTARFLLNGAIPLGTDAARAADGAVDDKPHESLAGGLSW